MATLWRFIRRGGQCSATSPGSQGSGTEGVEDAELGRSLNGKSLVILVIPCRFRVDFEIVRDESWTFFNQVTRRSTQKGPGGKVKT